MTQLAAVLFDMDGTTVETETLWEEAEKATMAQFGQEWTAQEQEFSLGGPFDKVSEYMAQKAGVPFDEVNTAMLRNIGELFRTRELAVQAGVQELFDEAKSAGLPIGLVTNSFQHLAQLVLEATKLDFDVVVASDDVEHAKPHPMPYLTACAALNVDPTHVVVLEDSPTGIASARAAGCAVIAIQHQITFEPAPRQRIVSSVAEVDLADLRALI